MEIWLDFCLQAAAMASSHRWLKGHTRKLLWNEKRLLNLSILTEKDNIFSGHFGEQIYWSLRDDVFFTVTYVQKASDWVGRRISVHDQIYTPDLKKMKEPKLRLHLILHCYSDTAFQPLQKSIFFTLIQN